MAEESKSNQWRVGIIYDERMLNHRTPDGEQHPENPNRISAIWNKLLSNNIPPRCVVLDAKEAEDKYLQLVHSMNHIKLIKSISSKQSKKINRIASKFDSIYFNKGSSEAAHIAAGSVIEVAERVATGELNSAAAIVRPPGHHAEHNEPMGFCLFNNVAVAASFLLDERPELGIKKILIVDWDVHHGNGTQKMFWKDPRVLVFSVHRHEFGSFYPGNDDGFYTMIGEGPGAGYNINVPWENGLCGDADYLAVWDHILIPVAKAFDADMVIVSAGYDAAVNDPLGGCCLTPYGYSVLLKKLMEFANGKIVLALEGGYNLDSTANSFLACMKVLLESKPIDGSSEACPFESTWRVIQEVRRTLSGHWPVLANELPLKLTSKKSPPTQWEAEFGSDVKLDDDRIVDRFADLTHLPTEVAALNRRNARKIASRHRAHLLQCFSHSVFLDETLKLRGKKIASLRQEKKSLLEDNKALTEAALKAREEAELVYRQLEDIKETYDNLVKSHAELVATLKKEREEFEASFQRQKDESEAELAALRAEKAKTAVELEELRVQVRSRDEKLDGAEVELAKAQQVAKVVQERYRALKHHYQKKDLLLGERWNRYRVNFRTNLLEKARSMFPTADLDPLALLPEPGLDDPMKLWAEDVRLFGGADAEGSGEEEAAEGEEEQEHGEEERTSYRSWATSKLSELGEAEDDATSCP